MTGHNPNVITDTMRKTNTGFTLIELMMTVVILSILVSLAVPAFNDTLRTNRLAAQSNDLITAVNLARAEAVKRRTTVTICSSNNQQSCTASNWRDGWIVRNDQDNDVLRAFPALQGKTTISGAPATITYGQRGFLENGNPVTLTLCIDAGNKGRRINITGTGRPSMVTPHPDC